MKTNDTSTIDLESLEGYFSPPLHEVLTNKGLVVPQNRINPDLIEIEPGGLDWEHPTAVDPIAEQEVGPRLGKRIAPSLKAMLAATLVNFVAFSARPQQTKSVEMEYLIEAIQQRRRSSVSVSNRLRIPRDRILSSSLFAPSGAYLTWLATDTEHGGR